MVSPDERLFLPGAGATCPRTAEGAGGGGVRVAPRPACQSGLTSTSGSPPRRSDLGCLGKQAEGNQNRKERQSYGPLDACAVCRRRAKEARAGSPNQPPPARLFITTHRSALTVCLLSFFLSFSFSFSLSLS